MIWYVLENEQLRPDLLNPDITEGLKLGWGNGYVAVPPSHCLYGHFIINQIHVHGGVTFSGNGYHVNTPKGWWVFGFDTSHWGDNLENWPKEAVIEETMSMFWQLVELEWGGL
jgi:hypothetical protein